MNHWFVVCFATIFVFACADHHQPYGYCHQNDTPCMNAWLQCHGKRPEAEGWLLLRMFWFGKLTVCNGCLQKYGEALIQSGIPEEDPDGGEPPASASPNAEIENPSEAERRFKGTVAVRLSQITNATVLEQVKCCYALGCEFIDGQQNLIPKTFIDLINQRFHKEPLIKEAHLTALEKCKAEPISNCYLVPFRDCMYKSCIDQMMQRNNARQFN